jgi:hypothetical protein
MRAQLLCQENFDASSGIGRVCLGVLASRTGGVKTRGNDPAVIEDEEVSWMKKPRKITKEVVAILTRSTIEDEHAAGATHGRRSLRDELFGEVEMEIGYTHCF